MKKIKKWVAKAWNWIAKTCKKTWNWIAKNWLLIVSILTPIILIVTKVCYPDFYGCIKGKTDLDFYQIILMAGAVIGLLWTNKRYKQGIAFKNKMNTQYLEVIKAISDKEKKTTPIVTNLINAIQASIAIFYDTEEKEMKARKETLNFRGINLAGGHLIGVHLTGANLTGADLKGADLKKADLTGAYLTGAYLTEADLRGADLKGADLTWANLTETDLRGANLIWTIFDIDSLNTLSLNQLDSAKNVAEIKIYIYSKDKSYSLKEFIKMNPANSITDEGRSLKGEMFDYLVELSKKN